MYVEASLPIIAASFLTMILQGDSGGPLVCRDHNKRWLLQGLTSLGATGCDKATGGGLTKPVIFTEVPSYVDWVSSVLGQYR